MQYAAFVNVYLLVGDAIAQGQETVGEMNVLKLHAGDGGIELHVRNVPETSYTHFHQLIGQLLRHMLGNAEDGDIGGTLFCKDLSHLFTVIDLCAVDFRAHKAGVNVKGTVHGKATGIEIEVVQQSMTQITDTHQYDVVTAIHAEDLTDLTLEVFYIITVTLLTELTEATEILTDLRGGEAHFTAEQIGGDADGFLLLQIVQITIVAGQSADNGIRNVLFLHIDSSFQKQDG